MSPRYSALSVGIKGEREVVINGRRGSGDDKRARDRSALPHSHDCSSAVACSCRRKRLRSFISILAFKPTQNTGKIIEPDCRFAHFAFTTDNRFLTDIWVEFHHNLRLHPVTPIRCLPNVAVIAFQFKESARSRNPIKRNESNHFDFNLLQATRIRLRRRLIAHVPIQVRIARCKAYWVFAE